MKQLQILTGWMLAMVAGSAWAQDANTVSQLSRLRNLPDQISQDFAQTPIADKGGKPWALTLGSGMTYTSNANLTSGGSPGDFYSTNLLGVRRQAVLDRGFTVSSGLAVTDYRYVRDPRLSTSFLDWDLMLAWSGASAGLDLQGYLSHTLEWTQQQSFETQTLSSILALGGSVSRKIVAGHVVTVASEISAAPATWPSENAYGCVSLSASYDWTVAPSITLNVSALGYETVYFTGRRDFTASPSATVTWAITPWLSASAFATPTWNFSTEKGGDYSVVDTGVNVSANWKF